MVINNYIDVGVIFGIYINIETQYSDVTMKA